MQFRSWLGEPLEAEVEPCLGISWKKYRPIVKPFFLTPHQHITTTPPQRTLVAFVFSPWKLAFSVRRLAIDEGRQRKEITRWEGTNSLLRSSCQQTAASVLTPGKEGWLSDCTTTLPSGINTSTAHSSSESKTWLSVCRLRLLGRFLQKNGEIHCEYVFINTFCTVLLLVLNSTQVKCRFFSKIKSKQNGNIQICEKENYKLCWGCFY